MFGLFGFYYNGLQHVTFYILNLLGVASSPCDHHGMRTIGGLQILSTGRVVVSLAGDFNPLL
jgi:hypothetical protein